MQNIKAKLTFKVFCKGYGQCILNQIRLISSVKMSQFLGLFLPNPCQGFPLDLSRASQHHYLRPTCLRHVERPMVVHCRDENCPRIRKIFADLLSLLRQTLRNSYIIAVRTSMQFCERYCKRYVILQKLLSEAATRGAV